MFVDFLFSICLLVVFFLFTAGFRIYLRLWNRLFSSLRSNDSTWRKNVTWYWETMGLHMHEPQWSGVLRMTHFDRYEVVMREHNYHTAKYLLSLELVCWPVTRSTCPLILNSNRFIILQVVLPFATKLFSICWKDPKEAPNASSGHASHSYAACHSDCLFLVSIVQ